MIPEFSQLNDLLYRGVESLRKTGKGDPAPQAKKVPMARKAKRKTTHYLREGIFVELDQAKKKIQGQSPEKQRSRVTKSRIVNLALSLVLRDFKKRGERSVLVRGLSSEKSGKKSR